VGRGVVRDDDLDVLVRLPEETLERLSQVPRTVVDGKPDAHPRSTLTRVHGRPRVIVESIHVVGRRLHCLGETITSPSGQVVVGGSSAPHALAGGARVRGLLPALLVARGPRWSI